MDQLGGPAVLAGIITGLMLWAWALGRWQRGFAAAPAGASGADPRSREIYAYAGDVPVAVRARHRAAFDERCAAIDVASSLGQLHAEVSAYRRTEQVLGHLDAEEMALGQSPFDADGRYLGLSEQPTCRITGSANAPCECGTCAGRTPGLSIRLDQPSAAASAFTRV